MTTTHQTPLELLTEQEEDFSAYARADSDPRAIIYKPRYNLFTGNVNASIVLRQMMYWWFKVGERPFYKFDAPCEHELYKIGDSWQEELGFSRAEFETARGRIAMKITKGVSKQAVMVNTMIVYWTTVQRLTYYELNIQLIGQKIKMAYQS